MARGGYRPGSGPAKGTKYRPRGTKETAVKTTKKKNAIPDDIIEKAKESNLTPLEYMLKVMNDQSADKDRRDRMAIAAAPFMHPRKSDGVGKKDEKADRAKSAGQGKFQAGRPPIALVK